MIPPGYLVVYVTPKKRRYIRRLEAGSVWHTNDGALAADDVAHLEYGDIAYTSTGMPVRVERPLLTDLLTGIKRKTQIIYPKDIAYICMKLAAGPGRTIIEAGCGSGALTLAFSWFCGAGGHVISFDAREEFTRLARRNLDWAGLGRNTDLHTHDIQHGFGINHGDALFLDLREPWLYLEQASQALKPGSPIGILLPTTSQISQLLAALESAPFDEIEVCELLLRQWKPLADRLRPADRMIAHTGFLVFARFQAQSREFDNYLPAGTRERKQIAAKVSRNASSREVPAQPEF